jgi:hypothetical protein
MNRHCSRAHWTSALLALAASAAQLACSSHAPSGADSDPTHSHAGEIVVKKPAATKPAPAPAKPAPRPVETKPSFVSALSTAEGKSWAVETLRSATDGDALSASQAQSLALSHGLPASTFKGASNSFTASAAPTGGSTPAKTATLQGGGTATFQVPQSWVVATPNGSVDMTAWAASYAPAELSALLGGTSAAGDWESPDADVGPKILVSESWSPAVSLVAGGASSASGGSSGGPIGLKGSKSPGGGLGAADDLATEFDSVIRYACCEAVAVRPEPTDAMPASFVLEQGEQVWVTDLTPGTGLQTAMTDIANCALAGDLSACGSAITQLAQASNVTYYAEIVRPSTGAVGYVPLQSLFVRPPQNVNTEATFEITWGLLADIIANTLEKGLRPEGCGDLGNSRTVHAGPKDIVFDPVRRVQGSCDDFIDCPKWVTSACPEDLTADDPAFANCIFTNAAECTTYDGSKAALLNANPDREPSLERRVCVQNVCPHKGTCETCREWMEFTDQDTEGLKTTTELIAECEAELQAANPDGDLPIQCVGGTKPNCVDYCHQAMQTYNVFACSHYIPPFQSRVFADSADYACGEYPVGATHVGYHVNLDTGGWTGSADPDRKVLTHFDLFDEPHVVEMGRLSSQNGMTVNTPDLTTGANRVINLGPALGLANIWLSLNPGPTPAAVSDTVDADSMLWFNVCAHLPGVSVFGPSNTYDIGQTPLSIIAGIDFGNVVIDRADICALGGLWFDDDLNPHIVWADGSVNIEVASIKDVKITKGIGYYGLAIAGSLLPVVGNIIRGIVLSEAAIEGAIESTLNNTEAGAWLANALLGIFEVKLVDGLLSRLSEYTDEALSEGANPNVTGRLEAVCDQLRPTVPNTHPYYYFYSFLAGQCQDAVDGHALRPFQRNAASASAGCYAPGAMFTPADAGGGHWWEKYLGQQWWMPFVPDSGCRMGVEFEAPVDIALAPVLRCGVGVLNTWVNAGLRLPNQSNNGGDLGSVVALGGNSLTPAQQAAAMGELPYMIATYCGGFGHLALESLYGDGLDLAQLYLDKHADGGGIVFGD